MYLTNKQTPTLGLIVALLTILVGILLTGGCTPRLSEAAETPTATPTPTLLPTATPTEVVAGKVSTATPTITLTPETPLCTDYELEIEHRVTNQIEGALYDEILYTGLIPFSADLSVVPPTLSGSTEIEVIGSGSAGGCEFIHEGLTVVTLSGNILSDASGAPKLQIHLDINWEEHRAVGISDECANIPLGGLTAPVETEAEHELPYEDGYTETWLFEFGTTTSSSTWILHILCE